ncbi:MAG: hypothetical protein K5770_05175 [Lachnospiraceae bacterium]|nr:hypothetical protein [Lachnospiraceae bacterium]
MEDRTENSLLICEYCGQVIPPGESVCPGCHAEAVNMVKYDPESTGPIQVPAGSSYIQQPQAPAEAPYMQQPQSPAEAPYLPKPQSPAEAPCLPKPQAPAETPYMPKPQSPAETPYIQETQPFTGSPYVQPAAYIPLRIARPDQNEVPTWNTYPVKPGRRKRNAFVPFIILLLMAIILVMAFYKPGHVRKYITDKYFPGGFPVKTVQEEKAEETVK